MERLTALVNGQIYTGAEVLRDHAVLISGEKILGTPARVPDEAERIDLRGASVAPGFIDIQVNGGGGALFNDDPSPEALKTISAAHEQYGTLHFCPTVISSGPDTIERALHAVGQAQGIGVLGAHLEGPFLSLKRPGIHDKRYIRAASDSEVATILEHGRGLISLVTAAPESVTENHIRRFAEADVRVFLGHSDASCTQAEDAFRAGACGVTHLYNAMSQLMGREPGVAGACFLNDGVWAGIIVDGHHVDYRSVALAKRIKGERLILVTDAMPPVGRPDAVYRIGPHEISCQNGRCAAPDGTLAGSALDMASAVRNSVRHCGIALDEALRMASTYPARMLGLENSIGAIREGLYADLVIFGEDVNVRGIVRRGKVASS